MRRSPVVAGQFYPSDPRILKNTLAALIPERPTKKQDALAVISPHAGYIYSGAVAGETFAAVNIPENVIILGPNHHGRGAAIALMAEGEWEMPLGRVAINSNLARLLTDPVIQIDELAHGFEHSLEVQIPFLQYLQKNLTIVPLMISHIPFSHCLAVGKAIAGAIIKYPKPVLLVASTDMTHYESRESATRKDHLALEHIRKLDPKGLYETVLGLRISMCGIMPSTVVLVAALELGAAQVKLIRYTDSGETSGDSHNVVGYAGLIIN